MERCGDGCFAAATLGPVPAVMGTSISSVAAYSGKAFPALQGAVGTGGTSGTWGQDWRSQCCAVGGCGMGVCGDGPPVGDGGCPGGMGWDGVG